ncbi:hypothetical protein I546_3756 [Mycobacterium kansasii 732]|nr:hypothetical protein I546_3756 [Mycobacterium kansasii 732]
MRLADAALIAASAAPRCRGREIVAYGVIHAWQLWGTVLAVPNLCPGS